MRNIRYLLTFICFLAVPYWLPGQPQQEQGQEQGQTGAGGPSSINLQGQDLYLEVLEDFEDAEDWVAKATSPVGETKSIKLIQRGANSYGRR